MNTKALWRWMLTLVAAIALTVSFTACGDDDDDKKNDDGNESVTGTASKLIGLWIDDEGEYSLFNADGSGFMYADNESGYRGDRFVDFKVTLKNGESFLYIKWEGEDWDEEAVIEFYKSSTFYLDYGSGSEDAFYRVK